MPITKETHITLVNIKRGDTVHAHLDIERLVPQKGIVLRQYSTNEMTPSTHRRFVRALNLDEWNQGCNLFDGLTSTERYLWFKPYVPVEVPPYTPNLKVRLTTAEEVINRAYRALWGEGSPRHDTPINIDNFDRASDALVQYIIQQEDQVRYLVEEAEVDVPLMVDYQKGWVTPQQWRAWRLGHRQREGELRVTMQYDGRTYDIEHVTYDDMTGQWWAHFKQAAAPVQIVLLNSLRVEFMPVKPIQPIVPRFDDTDDLQYENEGYGNSIILGELPDTTSSRENAAPVVRYTVSINGQWYSDDMPEVEWGEAEAVERTVKSRLAGGTYDAHLVSATWADGTFVNYEGAPDED